ncbi:MAG: hypothetical protein ABIH39_07895 [Candidatus Margulisiibacteriota bacterium]
MKKINYLLKPGVVVLFIILHITMLYGAHTAVTGNEFFSGGGGRPTGSTYSEDSAMMGGNGYSSMSDYEADSGIGALTEEQPVPAITINSTLGSIDYTNLSSRLTLSGNDSNYDIVSMNLSNTTTPGNWESVSNQGMSEGQSISTSNFAWTMAGSDGESKPVYIQLKNRLGVYSGRYSDTITLDTIAPNAPATIYDVVYGSTQADIDTAATGSAYAAWADATDARSGIYGYRYRIATTNGQSAWTDTSATANAAPGPYMIKGTTYYMAAQSLDNAGNESATVTSDGVAIGSPSIQIAKSGVNKGASGTQAKSASAAIIGEIIEYTIAYDNTGTYPAKPVNVYDMVPENSVYLTGTAVINNGIGTVYYITNFGNLTGSSSEPVPASNVIGLRWNINEVDVAATGNVQFRVEVTD